ncbi:MAG: HD domain-containing protein, partial [Candidatus Glassbacteria bacterium]
EVYGLSLDRLETLLAEFGRVRLVGRRFGVLRLDGLEVEWSVPRRDSLGRRPRVEIDPRMSFRDASRRRDLTMNALLMDVQTGEVIDPWNGRRDMADRILRTPDEERFVEDPLRFFRVMQFVARFEMQPDEPLDRTCRRMVISGVSKERIEEEFNKLWLEAARPSLGLAWLASVGRLGEVFPELLPMKDTLQEPDWHPEGDVWTHTLQVVDAAAALRTGDRPRDLMLLWSALFHDAGKPGTTVEVEGRIRSPEHDEAGAEIARRALERCLGSRTVLEGTVKLVVEHMKPLQFYQNESGAKAFKRLALKLSPEADLELLAALALADCRGTNPLGGPPLENDSRMVDWFRQSARESRVEKQPEKPVLLGRHLLDVLEPGPEMGRVLEAAYRIQIEEGITRRDELRSRALAECGIELDN